MGKMAKFSPKREPKMSSKKKSNSSVKVNNKKMGKMIKQGKVKPKTQPKYTLCKKRTKKEKKRGDLSFDRNSNENHNSNDFDLKDVMDMMPEKDLARMRMKRKRSTGSSDEEGSLEDFELKPRTGFASKVSKQVEESDQNVVNSAKKVRLNNGSIIARGDGEDEQGEDNRDPVDRAQLEPRKLSLVELLLEREQRMEELKERVAKLAISVINHPEKNINQLRALLVLLDVKSDEDSFKLAFISVQKLIAFSALEVFKDILPSYRVKEKIHEEEAGNKRLKKETKKLREFEVTILQLYKHFVHRLERMIECIKKSKKSSFFESILKSRRSRERIALVGTKCLTELLVAHPNFNYRKTVIDLIVPLMSNYKYKSISDMACAAITNLYKEDKLGEVSLEAIKASAKLVKALGSNVHPNVLRTFLSLKIKEVKKKQDKKDMKKVREKLDQMSRKEKKRNKQMKKMEKQLLETEAHEDQGQKLQYHTEILNQVFITYFRILKQSVSLNEEDDHERLRLLLTPVLVGLSKFAHLINVEFFDELIANLYQLIRSGSLDNNQALNCLHTVFTILSGEGSALNIDHQRFYSQLYKSVLNIDCDVVDEDVVLLHNCLDTMMFKRKKQITMPRVLAFAKRLATVSLQNAGPVGASLLSALRLLLQNHSQCDVLLDSENFGSGLFLPDVLDPEYSNANATLLWELHLLRRHHVPLVKRFSCHLINGAKGNDIKIDVIKKTPGDLFQAICEEEKNSDLLNENGAQCSKKNKFHGYIYSRGSLTSSACKALSEVE